MKRKAATPAGAVKEQNDRATRVEDPGANAVSEAAEAVPAESGRLSLSLQRFASFGT
ncbi:MAG TPA: hypothetical protein VLQ20_01305 [Planococcus sp. (in: firmicutes)]|nr:hypothetical protein [Planococcus sp. (in: firmicutes)]